MSLDLGSEGMAYNATKIAGTTAGLAALTLAAFDTGSTASDSTQLLLELDNSGTPSANIGTDLPAPAALGVVGGTKLTIINDTNGKKVTFVDPFTGITFSYVNKPGESISLLADDENDQWIMAF